MSKSVDHSVHKGGRRADIGRFADPFSSQRVMRRWCAGLVRLPIRSLDSGRDQIIHEGASLYVAVLVIRDFLHKRDRQAYSKAAVDRPFDDHRVDYVSAVINGHEAPNFHFTCSLVYVDHTDVGAERKCQVRWIVIVHGFQTSLQTRWEVRVSGKSNLLDRLGFTRCTFDVELSGFPFEVLFTDFEQMPGYLPRLFADFSGSHRCGSSSYWSATTGVGTKTIWRGVGVSFFDRDVSDRNPQLLRDDLSKGRLMPLPLSFGAHPCNRLAGRMNSDFTAVEHFDPDYVKGVPRSRSDNLSKAGNADSHQLASPAFVFLFFAQVAVTDFFQRQVHRGLIIAAVIAPTERALVGKLVGRNKIFKSQFDRIHFQFLSEHIHGSLD